jgi:ABC-2 type transport system permease protein
VTGLIRAELRKWSTTRMWFGLTLGGMVAVALITLITALTAGAGNGDNGPVTPALSDPAQVRTVYGVAFGIGSLFALILGVIAICGEFRHQTITPTFLATPRRSRVVVAKLAGIVLVAGISGILMILAGLVVGAIVISARGFSTRLGSGDVEQALLLSVLGLVVWSILGLGVGTLLKNQIAAILVVVGFTFIAEPLLPGVDGDGPHHRRAPAAVVGRDADAAGLRRGGRAAGDLLHPASRRDLSLTASFCGRAHPAPSTAARGGRTDGQGGQARDRRGDHAGGGGRRRMVAAGRAGLGRARAGRADQPAAEPGDRPAERDRLGRRLVEGARRRRLVRRLPGP